VSVQEHINIITYPMDRNRSGFNSSLANQVNLPQFNDKEYIKCM